MNDDTHRDWLTAAADTDNNIYFAGGYTLSDPRIWFSVTKGQTWAALTQVAAFPGLSTSMQFQYTLYNCMALTYNPTTRAKQLVMYAYETLFSDGSQFEAVTGEMNLPNGLNGWGTLPNATISASAAAAQLPAVNWPACSYNTHSLTASPLFVTAGGLPATAASPLTSSYTSSSASAVSGFTSAGGLPVGLYGASSVVLPNGAVMVMGGQSSNTSYSAAVYLSTGGAAYTQSTANAAFGARAEFISCVQPGTNAVVVVGGYTNATALSNSIFLSTDGTGSTWTQQGSFPINVAQGACVFLYDGAAAAGAAASNANATLLVFTHNMRLYRSITLGATFNSQPQLIYPGPLGYSQLPFPTQFDNTATRYAMRVVVDYDNLIYATAGYGVFDGNLWMSGDLGFTWYQLKQTVTASGLAGNSFLQASTACLGLYYSGGASTSAVKTLLLYSGLGVSFSSGVQYSAVTMTLDNPPTYLPSLSSTTAPNTTALSASYQQAQLSCPFPASTPAVQWSSYATTLPTWTFPLCGRDVHHLNSTTPVTLYQYGGQLSQNGGTAQSGFYASTTGFQTLSINRTDATIPPLTQGYMAVMPSGAVLVMGGRTITNTTSTSVYESTNAGSSFALSSSAFPSVYQGALIAVPYTNTLVLAAGLDGTSSQPTNNVYISQDGLAAVWSLQSASNPLPASSQGTGVALYDSSYVSASLYSSPNATLLYFTSTAVGSGFLTAVFRSLDLGLTWSAYSSVPFSTEFQIANSGTGAPAAPLGLRAYQNVVVDLANNVYAWGYSNALNLESDPTVWLSSDKAQTFRVMQLNPSTWTGKSAALEAYAFQYGCGALMYTTATAGAARVPQLVSYGGQVWISDGTLVSSATVNMLNVNATNVDAQLPQLSLQSPLNSSTVANLTSPACAYNVHARNGVMLAVGSASSSSASSLFIASAYSFSSAANVVSYALPLPGLTAAGLALLNSGTVLLFGGQSAIGYSQTVYATPSSSGIAFRTVTTAAPWSARANMVSCVQPFSNTMLMFGGVGSAGELSDGWVNNDGLGATWTALPTPIWGSAGLQSGACVFLYDSALIPSGGFTQASSTLLVFTDNSLYYRSTTAGQSWVAQPNAYTPNAPNYQTAPWATQPDATQERLDIRVVADFDNVLYAAAGSVRDGAVYMSADKAMTWYRLAQRNAASANAGAQLLQATSACMALNYRSAGGSSYSKALVLYAGSIQLTDGTQLTALNLLSNGAITSLVNVNASAFNSTPGLVNLAGTAQWTALPTPPWTARSHQGFAVLSRSASYSAIAAGAANGTGPSTVSAPAGSLVAFGGTGSDVWLSTTSGSSWSLISGAGNGSTATTSNLITSAASGCALYDPLTSRFYSFASTAVYVSTDAVNWNVSGSYAQATGGDFSSMGCTINSNTSTLYLLGGNQAGGSGITYANDVWASYSPTPGSVWNQSTALARWSNRDTVSSWSAWSPYLRVNVLTIFGGDAEASSVLDNGVQLPDRLNNEVWASSDNGVNWRLLGYSPFPMRDHSTMGTQVTPAGVVIITSGKLSESVTLYANDVWASMDGGLTWGQCSSGAGFLPREDLSTALDAQGYFYVSGGTAQSGSKLQDLWRSPFSFNNITAVLTYCGLSLPAGGPFGLRCWPISDGVYGSPCNTTGSGSGSAGSSGGVIVPPAASSSSTGAAASGGPGSVQWTALPTPPWTARSHQGFAVLSRSASYSAIAAGAANGTGPSTVSAPAGSLVAFGGTGSDVWLSTTSGSSWSLISGAGNGSTATTSNLITSAASGCALYDPLTSRFYSFASTAVYVSTDAVNWNVSGSYAQATGGDFSSMGCTINSNTSTLYLLGGNQAGGSGITYANDVWASYSPTPGSVWNQSTALARWSNRDTVSSWSAWSPYLRVNVLTIFGGDAEASSVLDNGVQLPDRLNNEVWASSDNGVNWRLLGYSPFPMRDHSTMGTQVTPAGVVIITSGKLSESVTLYANDVWASMDGGLTWGQCSSGAGFLPREDLSTALDAQGYFYVSGGTAQSGSKLQDLWRSPFSFNNITAVLTYCGLSLPAGGPFGLRCWPISDGVYGSPCNTTGSGSGSAGSSGGVIVPPAASSSSTGAAASGGPGSVQWTALPTPPWTARSHQGFAVLSRSASYSAIAAGAANGTGPSTVSAPAGSLVAFGGTGSDVWLSTTSGSSWSLISGAGNGSTATTSNLITSAASGCALYDPLTSRFYSFASTAVYVSTDAVNWNVSGSYAQATGGDFSSMGCTINSNTSTLYLLGGNQAGGSGITYANDVWASYSPTPGSVWNQSTALARWSNRDTVSSWSAWSPYLRVNVLTIFGGDAEASSVLDNGVQLPDRLNNEVWASSDNGVNWRLLGYSPFPMRDHSTMGTQVTPAGVVIITSGKLSESVTLYANDVWASMDGGLTWGQCSSGAGFLPREDLSTALDAQGYFYVSGGTAQSGSKLQDLWRSPFSFNNITAVLTYCGLSLPAGGPFGLRCWPISDGVYGSPCNTTGSGSGSAGSSGGVIVPPAASSSSTGAAASGGPGSVQWTALPTPPWTARSHQGFAVLSRSASYSAIAAGAANGTGPSTVSAPAGSLVAFGGTGSDVWLSTTSGSSWSLISGAGNGSTATTSNLITSAASGCALYDPLTSRFYSFASTAVYVSTDAVNWNVSGSYAQATGGDFSSMGCTINSNTSTLYLLGGNQAGGSGITYANDVWASYSPTPGSVWNQSTALARWSNRDTVSSWSAWSPYLRVNVLTIFGGDAEASSVLDNGVQLPDRLNNEVWASSDNGVNWRLLGYSPFPMRDHSTMGTQVTPAGVVIITSGKLSESVTLYANDVWASMDGGLTWGQCSSGAGFLPREDLSTALDAQGYFYVSGGTAQSGSKLQDLWRSPFSFNNITAVLTYCGLSLPAGGPFGLRCWPISDGVYGSPCNTTGSGSSAAAVSSSAAVPAGTSAPRSVSSSAAATSAAAGGGMSSSTGATRAAAATSAPATAATVATAGGAVTSPATGSPPAAVTSAAAPSATTSSTAPAAAGGGSGSSGLSGGAIAGIVIGSVVGALLLVLCCVMMWAFSGKRSKPDAESRETSRSTAPMAAGAPGEQRASTRDRDTEESHIEMQ